MHCRTSFSPGMSKDLFTVDAFSEVPFKGNPAAVVLLHADDEISNAVLQTIAEELNLSETAFVRPVAGGDASGEYNLRWFTPTNEVPLCGHATLASAHALFNHPSRGASLPRLLRFNTLSGQLTVERLADGHLSMVLPLNPPVACSQTACATPSSHRSAPLISFTDLTPPCVPTFDEVFPVTVTRRPFQLLLEATLLLPCLCLSAPKNSSSTSTPAWNSCAACRCTLQVLPPQIYNRLPLTFCRWTLQLCTPRTMAPSSRES